MIDDTGTTLRTAIVVHKGLAPGAVASAAAILMGQLAHLEPSLYDPEGVTGADGVLHAGVRYSTVVLAGRPGRVAKLPDEATAHGVSHTVFSQLGRSLHNDFARYTQLVNTSSAADLDVYAVGLAGPDPTIRALTKPFSLYE